MTKEERLKIYAALAAPFPEEAIERTDGRVTGRGYSTTGIKYQYAVNRLNEVLGVGGYRVQRTVTVREVATSKGRPAFEALCEVRLELGEWVGSEFVPFAEAIGDGGHTAMSEADARKGAFTNAFKKTAAFFGVGRQAYEGSLDDDNVPAEDQPPAPQPPRHQQVADHTPPVSHRPSSSSPVAASAPPADNNGRVRLTSKQLGLIWALAENQGYSQPEFRGLVKERFGVQPEYLTKQQASLLITSMGQNGGQRAPGQEG